MRFVFIGYLFFSGFSVFSQVSVSGIVVDSLSFESLPNVHIRVKHKGAGTVTDEKGFFRITVAPFDTLQFSNVGYFPYEFPVLVDEKDIIILMSQNVTYLHQVTVTGSVVSPLIKEKKKVTYQPAAPEKLMSGSGISFSYFSRQQREKRRLQKLVEANEKTKAYTTVVSDPDFRVEIMKTYGISEDEYYRQILRFNQTRMDQVAWKPEDEVIRILHDYFCAIRGNCR